MTAPIEHSWAEEGLEASFTLGARLRSENESGLSAFEQSDEGTSLVTTLGFNLTSVTRSQSLNVSLDTSIPYYLSGEDNSGNSDFEIEDPRLRLSYTVESKPSVFSIDASFLQSDVGTSNFFDEALGEDVVIGGGTRSLTTFAPRLVLGREGPVTADLGYRFLDSSYSDANPDLSDSTTQALDGRVTFAVTPTISTFAFANWREEDFDNIGDLDRETSSVGLGGEFALSEITRVSAQMSFDDEKDLDDQGNEVRGSDGLGFGVDLSRNTPGGDYSLSVGSTETINGFRHRASFGRDFSTPRTQFDFSLGAVKNEGESVEPLLNVNIGYDLSETSQISLSLDQSSDVNDDGNNTIRNRLNLNYRYEVNSISSLSANFRLAADNETGSDAIDSRTFQTGLSYNRAVGGDWDLVSGISFLSEQADNRDDRNTSTVFVGLEKRFDWRP